MAAAGRHPGPVGGELKHQVPRALAAHLWGRAAFVAHALQWKELPMTTLAPTDVLLANLDRVVQDTLAYFDGPGRTTTARVDQWQARDILMHFVYFHDATAWGIQSATLGGPPWPVPADADTVNEICRRLHEHESFDELLTQLRQAHGRLVRAARGAA